MERTWWERFTCSADVTERDRRNSRIVNYWAFSWMAVWVGATFLIKGELVTGEATLMALALAPNILGVATVRAYIRFLREAEELQRKVQLDALAVGFGVGMVAIVGLELLGDIGFFEAGPSDALMFMIMAYSLGVMLGWRRYR